MCWLPADKLISAQKSCRQLSSRHKFILSETGSANSSSSGSDQLCGQFHSRRRYKALLSHADMLATALSGVEVSVTTVSVLLRSEFNVEVLKITVWCQHAFLVSLCSEQLQSRFVCQLIDHWSLRLVTETGENGHTEASQLQCKSPLYTSLSSVNADFPIHAIVSQNTMFIAHTSCIRSQKSRNPQSLSFASSHT